MKRLKARYGCPVEFTLDVLGGKWKAVILARLKDNPLRYRELRASMLGLSDKMLTQRLQDLQAAGLIAIEKDDEKHRVYALTSRGNSLRPVLQALFDWGSLTASGEGIAVT